MKIETRERLVRAIMAAAQPELARRAAPDGSDAPHDDAREALVAAIMASARPELLRRQGSLGQASTIQWVDRRWRELAAAAAVVAALALGALGWSGVLASPAEAQVPTLAEAIAPETIAGWLVSGEAPLVADMWLDLEAVTEETP